MNDEPNGNTTSDPMLARLQQALLRAGFDVNDLTEDDLAEELLFAKYAINDRLKVSDRTASIPEYYEGVQIELCMEAISKYGAEGEVAHSENGISRTYDSASRYSTATLNKIIPRFGAY